MKMWPEGEILHFGEFGYSRRSKKSEVEVFLVARVEIQTYDLLIGDRYLTQLSYAQYFNHKYTLSYYPFILLRIKLEIVKNIHMGE